LDVFRGAAVCLMILVNNPGNWSHIYTPLEHAPWHGLTPTDLVFPFFLFAVGNAMAFVMPKLETGGNLVFWKKIVKRTLIIFLTGLFLNWLPFVKWDDGHLVFKQWVDPNNPANGIRILGVLQRIALCYFFASIIIYYLKPKGAFLAGLILLLLYWMLCYVGNPYDPYSLAGWFGTDIDKAVLGIPHMYKGEGVPFDPEGLMSTIPAIVQVIFGYLVGDYIQKKSRLPALARPNGSSGRVGTDVNDAVGQAKNSEPEFNIDKTLIANYGPYQMVCGLFVAGVALVITAYCWGLVFPINKKIWTSSYTVYTTGLATVTIATMIYLIEIKKIKGWLSRFFDVFGKNALFVFALSAFLPKCLSLIRFADHLDESGKIVYINPWNWLYQKVLINIPGAPEIGSLAYALCIIIFMWAICYWLDKKKIYVKV
ncbi:MAG: heparan-alpha-glucosaminide N-acetyltransferase domain-containing protein, partial [Bacteroidota bacterium]|nr:heparan-alpha-glucosaminide N-acetyltransferase domain-containing protein [Bacteroidota bacterium]